MKKRFTISAPIKHSCKWAMLFFLVFLTATSLFAQTSTVFSKVIDKITTNPATGYLDNSTKEGNPSDGSAIIYLSAAYKGKVKDIVYHTYNLPSTKLNPAIIEVAENDVVRLKNLYAFTYEILSVDFTDGTSITSKDHPDFFVYSTNRKQIPFTGVATDYTKNMEGSNVTLFTSNFALGNIRHANISAAQQKIYNDQGAKLVAYNLAHNITLASAMAAKPSLTSIKATSAQPSISAAATTTTSARPSTPLQSCDMQNWTCAFTIWNGTNYEDIIQNSCGLYVYAICTQEGAPGATSGQAYQVISGNFYDANMVLQQSDGQGQTITEVPGNCPSGNVYINGGSCQNNTLSLSVDGGIYLNVQNYDNTMWIMPDGTRVYDVYSLQATQIGTYNVNVYNGSCVWYKSITIYGTPGAPGLSSTNPTCAVSTGSISVNSANGATTFSLDGGAYTGTSSWSGLAAGSTHTVTSQNAGGCQGGGSTINIGSASATPAAPVVTVTQPTCAVSTATLTVTIVSGATYSFDNGATYQASNIKSNAAASTTYNIRIKTSAGCVSTNTSTTTGAASAVPTAPTLTKTDPSCSVATGSINVTSTTASLTFSLDGGAYSATSSWSGLVAGTTHSVIAKNASGCTSGSTSITLGTSPAGPVVPIAAAPTQPNCTTPTGSFTITNYNAAYTYTFSPASVTQSGNSFTAPAGTYTVKAQNGACSSAASTAIVIIASSVVPQATIALAVTSPLCTGTTVSFNVAVNNSTVAGEQYTFYYEYSKDNGTTWTWWFTGIGGSAQPGGAYVPNAPGLWKFRVTVSNSCGSNVAVSSALLIKEPTPQPYISLISSSACNASTVVFNAGVNNSVTGETYTYTFKYSNDNGVTWTKWYTGANTSVWTTPSYGPVSNGLWKFRVIADNGCGLDSATTGTLSVVTPTTPTLIKTDPTCTTGTASISVSPVDPTFTYSLDGGAYGSTTTWSSLAAGSTHSVTAQTAGGCPSAAATITVGTAPTKLLGTITGNQTPCFTDSLVLTAGGGSAYSWTINSLTGASAGNTATIKVKPLVVTTYFVKITNGSCSDTQNVVVNAARPALILTTVITICKGNTQDVIADGGGIAGYTYRWIAPAAVAGITTPKLTAMMPFVTTAYTVERTTPAGCKDTATDTIIVYQQPVLGTVVKTDAACNGINNGTITINATSPSNLVIEYSINGTTWQTSNVYSNLAPGAYSISARNQNGICQAMTGANVTIGRLSGPVSGIAAPPRGCAQETVEFDVTPTVPNATYAWTVTNNSGGPIPPYITGSSNGTSYIVSFPPAVPDQTVGRGETITLAVSLNGCTSNYVSQINITGPVFSHGGPDTTVCLGGQLFLGLPAAAAGPSGASFSWGPADMIQGTTTASQFTTVPLFADQEYDLTVTDALNGCTHTSKVFVAISTALNPRAKAGASRMVLAGATSNLGSPITSVSDAISKVGYTWSTVTGVNGNANLYSPTDNQPIFLMPTPATPYRYALKVRRQFNGSSNTPGLVCYAYDSVNITILAAPVPDLVPKLIFNPSVVIGIQTVEVMIQLSEIANVVTNGSNIQFLIDKNSNLGSFNYNPTQAKNTAGLAIQNSLFTVDATSSPDYYIFTSVAPILLKNSTRRIVYTVVPLGTKAKLPISLYLRHGDGGETNFSNDTFLGSLNLQ